MLLTELDLHGCAAPACEAALPAPGPLGLLVGPAAAPFVQTVAAEWCTPLCWSAAWSDAWTEHGHLVVHAWHDVEVHRPLPGTCRLSASVVAQRPTRAGALTVLRYAATDDAGPVWTSRVGALWRGLGTTARGLAEEPVVPGCDETGKAVDVPADLPRRYSDTSGIWNPIHTDPAAARAAGLPAPLLHGSATLALAVAALGRSSAPRRLRARFVAPVLVPDRLVVAARPDGAAVDGEARASDGAVVLRFRADYDPKETP